MILNIFMSIIFAWSTLWTKSCIWIRPYIWSNTSNTGIKYKYKYKYKYRPLQKVKDNYKYAKFKYKYANTNTNTYYIPVLLFALITLFRPCAITVTLPVQCLLFIINDNDVWGQYIFFLIVFALFCFYCPLSSRITLLLNQQWFCGASILLPHSIKILKT